jgi:hypothetical protein
MYFVNMTDRNNKGMKPATIPFTSLESALNWLHDNKRKETTQNGYTTFWVSDTSLEFRKTVKVGNEDIIVHPHQDS